MKSLTPPLNGGGGYGLRACLDPLLALPRPVLQRGQALWRPRGIAKLRLQIASLEPTWPQQGLSELS